MFVLFTQYFDYYLFWSSIGDMLWLSNLFFKFMKFINLQMWTSTCMHVYEVSILFSFKCSLWIDMLFNCDIQASKWWCINIWRYELIFGCKYKLAKKLIIHHCSLDLYILANAFSELPWMYVTLNNLWI